MRPEKQNRLSICSNSSYFRYRLPETLDHMLAFIYCAYLMTTLLSETVSAFENTWIECLSDLRRYRMTIENANSMDRNVWNGVTRFWYSKAVNKNPNVKRLCHHLAVLARPYSLQQLSYVFIYDKEKTYGQPHKPQHQKTTPGMWKQVKIHDVFMQKNMFCVSAGLLSSS